MRVRFFRKSADAERNAGRVMCEKTVEDHTSAGVAPTVACDVATDKDQTAYPAEWAVFSATEAPAAEVAPNVVTDAGPDSVFAAVKRRAKSKR